LNVVRSRIDVATILMAFSIFLFSE
jgi:hypothetical protein